MDDCTKVCVTGFYATGSSALIDLLKEYSGIQIAAPIDGDYEHILLYANGGLFNLLDTLLSDTHNPYSDDIAINNFIKCSNWLNDNDFGWVGSFKKYYGSKFLKITNDFIDSISYKKERKGTSHLIGVRFSLTKAIIQIVGKIIYKRPIHKLGRRFVYDNNSFRFCFATRSKILENARIYVSSYIDMCSKPGKVGVFDHLLWPQHCFRIDELFDNGFKAIIVDRDPRDVFLLNKYYLHNPPVSISKPYYSTNVNTFCEEWIKIHAFNCDRKNVLLIHFEDLIYKYESTKEKIQAFLGLPNDDHINSQTSFVPSESIENTQIFLTNSDWRKEISVIENRLADFLYSFPCERVPDKSKWFDTDTQRSVLRKKKNN